MCMYSVGPSQTCTYVWLYEILVLKAVCVLHCAVRKRAHVHVRSVSLSERQCMEYADICAMYGDVEDALCAFNVVVFVRVDAHKVLQKNSIACMCPWI